MFLSSWKSCGFKKELNYLYCWTCLVFLRLVCLPTWPICSRVFQTSEPWQHLNLLSGSKECLQDASFLQVLLKKEAFCNSVLPKTQFVYTGLCQCYESHILHHIFVEEASPGSSCCLQLQWGQGAAPCPAPACVWSHSAAPMVEALWFQGQLRASGWRALAAWELAGRVDGCWMWVLHNPINYLFWHKYCQIIVHVTIILPNPKHPLKKDKGNYMSIIAKHTNECGIEEKGAGVQLPAPWHQPEPGCFFPWRIPSNLCVQFPIRRFHLSAALCNQNVTLGGCAVSGWGRVNNFLHSDEYGCVSDLCWAQGW